MVAKQTLTLSVLVRFQIPPPNKSTLRQFDSDSMRDAACIASSVLLFGSLTKEKVMKRKQIAAPRRMFMVAAKFKSGAGVHRKSHKAMRRQEKVNLREYGVNG